MMFDFFTSVASNLAASVIVALIAWITRKIWLEGFYSDIARVYKSQAKALKEINRDILKSPFVKILAIRARSITEHDRGDYPSLWKSIDKKIEIIISSEDNDTAILARCTASGSSPEEYRMDISYSNKILRERMSRYRNLTVFNHHENLSFRLIIMEQCVYVCYFLPEKSVHKSSVIKYKSNTGAYDAFMHYYNSLRNNDSTTEITRKTQGI